MITKKKRKFIIVFLTFAIVLICLAFPCIMARIKLNHCHQIYADKIIKLPDKENNNLGFTGTGLFWDSNKKVFLIGNAGKIKPNEDAFQATIEIVDQDFSIIKSSIPCYLNFINMRDIQGVSKSIDDTIWFCSYGENKVRHIDIYGNEIGSFSIAKPSGIAYDTRDNTIWILTDYYLYNCTYEGTINKKIKVHVKGQDHLFLDEKNNLMYFSAGANYYGDSYIYTLNLETNELKPLYVLKDSYAIEGITIIDNSLYVLNDGYYHNAKVAVNQVNIYNLDDLKVAE